VEKKLNGEIEVLLARMEEMEATAANLKKKIKQLYAKKDVANAKACFVQLKNVQKQIVRFTRLYQVCSSMLDHVKEQALMSSTSSVLREFVSMHGRVVEECKLDQMVAEYQDLGDRVRDAGEDLGIISSSLMREDDDEFSDENIALALEAFLAEEEEEAAPLATKTTIVTAPTAVTATTPKAGASAPSVASVEPTSLPSLPVAPAGLVVGEPVDNAPVPEALSLAQLY
jgi:hypothetical protein